MSTDKNNFVFPKWVNKIPVLIAVSLIGIVLFVIYLFWYWFSKSFRDWLSA